MRLLIVQSGGRYAGTSRHYAKPDSDETLCGFKWSKQSEPGQGVTCQACKQLRLQALYGRPA